MNKILNPSKIERLLKLDPNDEENIWLSKQKTLRAFIGVLGILLPIMLYGFLLIDTGYDKPLESISHYYYTRVSSILVITVSLLAIFLIIYKGKGRLDIILSTLAGVFALCLILFPTDNITTECCDPNKIMEYGKSSYEECVYSVSLLRESDSRVHFHYFSAGIFLSSLAFMSLFQFTKSDHKKKDRSKNKRIRNFFYSLFGILIVLSLIVIACGELFKWIPAEYFSSHHIKYWMEVVALESFGISWLIKAEVILKG
ncbi:MAG: hypothetical protein WBP41_03795 [Saprospiraceae bacterium]